MLLTPQEQQIDQALEANLQGLKDAFFDLLAALLLVLISVTSLLHGLIRLVFAGLGLLLWALAFLNVWLYGVRARAVARSASSIHRGL